jgi:hypothetical protein
MGLATRGIVPERPGSFSIQFGNGLNVVFFQWDIFSTFTAHPKQPAQSAGFVLSQYADSREAVDETIARAVAAGGQQLGGIADEPWGYTGGFMDPDGHHWNIFFSPTGPM